jgi:hypothetical protein
MADQKKFWAPGHQFYDDDGDVNQDAVAAFAAAVVGRVEQSPVPKVERAEPVDDAALAAEFEERAPRLGRVGALLREVRDRPDEFRDTAAARDVRRERVRGRAVARQLSARDRERDQASPG